MKIHKKFIKGFDIIRKYGINSTDVIFDCIGLKSKRKISPTDKKILSELDWEYTENEWVFRNFATNGIDC